MANQAEPESSFLTPYEIKHGKRLEKNNYTNIINKVASLYDKVSPRGCSQNTKIQYEDVEFAKNMVKSRERELKTYQISELSKLNNHFHNVPSQISNPKKKSSMISPKISKRYCLKDTEEIKKTNVRFKSVENVIHQCNIFYPELNPDKKKLLSHTYLRLVTAKRALNYIQDLSECMRSSGDPEKVSNMLSTLTYNRKISEKLQADMGDTRQDLLKTTDAIIRMGNHKLWRQNNVSFMTATDKLISTFY